MPIDSAAFAYQLADFKIMARRAGRFLDLTFFSFCLSSFDAIPPAGALVRTKNLPTILQSALIERRRIGNKTAARCGVEDQRLRSRNGIGSSVAISGEL
jgi:hypothetical protein